MSSSNRTMRTAGGLLAVLVVAVATAQLVGTSRGGTERAARTAPTCGKGYTAVGTTHLFDSALHLFDNGTRVCATFEKGTHRADKSKVVLSIWTGDDWTTPGDPYASNLELQKPNRFNRGRYMTKRWAGPVKERGTCYVVQVTDRAADATWGVGGCRAAGGAERVEADASYRFVEAADGTRAPAVD